MKSLNNMIIYILKKIARKIIRCWFAFNDLIKELINSIIYLEYKDPILIKAWVKIQNGKIVPNNWGDDINIPFLQLITNRKVLVCNHSIFHKITKPHHYLCIGSLLGDYETEKSEIWGSGFISDADTVKAVPLKIHSVRGKLSRKKFLDSGIDCPECYGDPALLISRFYQPEIKKKYKVGIIPNHIDLNNDVIRGFIANHNDSILIRLDKYSKWTNVVDLIISCDYIISSSLHGLIIADSYSIPNDWVFFSDNIIGGYFKYLDYFSSVGRKEREPIWIKDVNQILKLIECHTANSLARIDFDSIINSCPFKVHL